MVEGVVVNADQQTNNQRQKQLYIIYDHKNPDGIVKRARIHIKYVVAVPVLVPVPVNLPYNTPLLTETTTTIAPVNPSTIFPSDTSTHVDPAPVTITTTTTTSPALLPKTATVPANFPTSVAPAPDPVITTTISSNPPYHVIP